MKMCNQWKIIASNIFQSTASPRTLFAQKNEASVVHFNVYNEKLNITVVAVTLHKNVGRKKSITDKHRKRRTN